MTVAARGHTSKRILDPAGIFVLSQEIAMVCPRATVAGVNDTERWATDEVETVVVVVVVVVAAGMLVEPSTVIVRDATVCCPEMQPTKLLVQVVLSKKSRRAVYTPEAV